MTQYGSVLYFLKLQLGFCTNILIYKYVSQRFIRLVTLYIIKLMLQIFSLYLASHFRLNEGMCKLHDTI